MRDNSNKVIQLTPEQYEHRRDLAEAKITLDGLPAMITGLRMRFAVIQTVNGYDSAEFAWETVERIIKNDGKFKS